MAIKKWKFERQDFDFKPIPIGKHRVRIADMEQTVSKAGNDMVKMTLDVSGHSGSLWNYTVFMDENEDRVRLTNKLLTGLIDSFDMKEEDIGQWDKWIGKVGACVVKHDADDRAVVSYFLNKEQQKKLPAWREPNVAPSVKDAPDGFEEDADDIPF